MQEHRCAEPHQLQHEVRHQDAHDDLSWHGSSRVHGFALDHRQLDAATVRKVTIRECLTTTQPILINHFILFVAVILTIVARKRGVVAA